MNREMQIIREINEQAELFYESSQELGILAAKTIGEKERHRAQMTGLENVAETTLKTSDVFDYIKKQIARVNFDGWRKTYGGKTFGESLIEQLEHLKGVRNTISLSIGIREETIEDRRLRQHIYLNLMRQFIRQVVVRYEYEISLTGQKERNSRGTDRRASS